MKNQGLRMGVFVALFLVGLMPAVAWAQSAIAGMARDANGAPLAGVKVVASSTALIERERTTATDGAGQYKILDLRPGTYSVVFTLANFKTVRREGIDVLANVTVPISAGMETGSADEVVVKTEAPVVDVQQSVTQQVLAQKSLDEVPMGGRNIQSTGATQVGVQQSAPDVGGGAGMQQTYMTAHGSDPRDNTIMVDGIRVNGIEGNGAIQQYFNTGAYYQMGYSTSGLGAETSGGGVRLNMIPKDGGNTLKGDVFFSTTSGKLQANPTPPELVAQGLKAGNAMDSMTDLNVSVGGPLVVNKLWLFGSVRRWGVNQVTANSFYGSSTATSFTPDLSRTVPDDNLIKSFMARITAQATRSNKFSFYLDRIIKFRGHEAQTPPGTSVTLRGEDSFGTRIPRQYYTSEAKWSSTLTSKLLIQAGIGINNESYTTAELQPNLEDCLAAGTCAPRGKVDLGTGYFWGAPAAPFYVHMPIRDTGMASVAYVTGSHAFKVGMELSRGLNFSNQSYQNPAINFVERYRNGVPNSVIIYLTPIDAKDRLKADLGLYIQDTWTMKRLTLTPGLRWDYWKTGYDEQGVSAESQALMILEGYPQRPLFPGADMPTWKDWSPRVGAAYDLFGSGKTAIKGSVNKYMIAYSTTTYPQIVNPMGQSQNETRTWTDTNGNLQYDPGIDALSARTNDKFGLVWRSLDPDIKRPYNIEYSVGVQHELRPGMSLDVGYYHRNYYDAIYSYNTAIKDNPTAYTATTIPNPCASGTIACGGVAPPTIAVYALDPALRGKGSVVDTNSTNSRVYDGFEATFRARIGRGQFFGGVNTQRQVSNECQSMDTGSSFSYASDPNYGAGGGGQFCDQTQYDIPFTTQAKIGGSYPMPFGFNLSGTLQSYPGTPSYGSGTTATNWEKVTLANSAATGVIPSAQTESNTIMLIEPGSKYLPRYNQLDIRVSRKFNLRGGANWNLQVDLFNALNAHAILARTSTYGANLDVPTTILQSRIVSFGAQLHF